MQSTESTERVNDSQGGTNIIEASIADVSKDRDSQFDAHHDCDPTIAGNGLFRKFFI